MALNIEFVTIECLGETFVHFPDHNLGSYATLCGMDGDDGNSSVQQKTIKTKPGAKVNCRYCISIWEACQAYRRNEISWGEYNSRQ